MEAKNVIYTSNYMAVDPFLNLSFTPKSNCHPELKFIMASCPIAHIFSASLHICKTYLNFHCFSFIQRVLFAIEKALTKKNT